MENKYLLAIVSVVLVIVLFIVLLKWIKKFENRKRLFFPLIYVLIGTILSLLINFEIIYKNTKILNTISQMLLAFSGIIILDYIIRENYLEKKKIRMPKLIHDIIMGSLYIIIFLTILRTGLDVNLTPILTTSAVLSMVIGLALQDTLANFIAGVVLHIETPFKFGDWVLVNNIEGKIVEINWRTVKLLTFQNDFLVIPNNNIVKDSIINFNYPTSNHILSMNIGTSYDDPPNHVKNALLYAINDIDNILKNPKPVVRLINYNDFSIDYEVRVWIKDYGKKKIVENEYMTKLWYIFNREGIKIPFPIRDVYLYQDHKSKDSDKQKVNLNLIKNVYLFQNMEDELQAEIANKVDRVIYGKDEVIFNKGDKGDTFFIILSGEVLVIIDENQQAILKKNDFMGEMSLFTGKDRNAKTIAKTDCEFITLNRGQFSEVLLAHKNAAEEISNVIAERELRNEAHKNRTSEEQGKENKKIEDETRHKKKSILNSIKKLFNV